MVFSKAEIKKIIILLDGVHWLITNVLYGSGLRLNECVSLRVQDIDSDYRQIIVRNAKGEKDRTTILPDIMRKILKSQIEKIKMIHENDIRNGNGTVYLPYAIERKFVNANRDLKCQYLFPSKKIRSIISKKSP